MTAKFDKKRQCWHYVRYLSNFAVIESKHLHARGKPDRPGAWRTDDPRFLSGPQKLSRSAQEHHRTAQSQGRIGLMNLFERIHIKGPNKVLDNYCSDQHR